MNRTLLLLSLIGVALTTNAAHAAISVSIGEPGFYGRIDIGGAPPPVVLLPDPIVVLRSTRPLPPPIYLRVPPGHEKHWDKHCRSYNACGMPVYFVRDNWYRDVYAPHYREHHGHGRDHDDHDRGRDDHDHDHGRGHDRGHHGKH